MEYKIKKLYVDDENTIKNLIQLGLISIPNDKEIMVHDKKIMELVETLETVKKHNQDLENQIQVLKKQQSTSEIAVNVENEKLRKELNEKINSVSEYQNQIKVLEKQLVDLRLDYESLQDIQKDDTKIKNQVKELNNKVNNFNTEKKELLRVNDSLKQGYDEMKKKLGTITGQLNQVNSEKNKLKQDLDKVLKLSGYGRLVKESVILRSFIGDPVKREFQLEEEFKSIMSSPTIRRCLYHLTEIGLLSKIFSGQYELSEDLKDYDSDNVMSIIVSKVMGADFNHFINTVLDTK